jgi:hypothetical protein
MPGDDKEGNVHHFCSSTGSKGEGEGSRYGVRDREGGRDLIRKTGGSRSRVRSGVTGTLARDKKTGSAHLVILNTTNSVLHSGVGRI